MWIVGENAAVSNAPACSAKPRPPPTTSVCAPVVPGRVQVLLCRFRGCGESWHWLCLSHRLGFSNSTLPTAFTSPSVPNMSGQRAVPAMKSLRYHLLSGEVGMNTIRTFLVALAISGAVVTSVRAQGPACGPDPTCPDAQWDAPQLATVNLNVYGLCGPTCQAIVTWQHRDACGSCDIAITEIRAVPGSNCSCSVQNFFKESVAALLLLLPNPLPCGPSTPGECSTTWRVMTGGCWKPDNRYVTGFVSCPGASCCFATYKVCLTLTGRTFTQTSDPQMQFPCDQVVPDPECVPVCNSLPKSNTNPS